MLNPKGHPIALLPEDRELMRLLGLSEAEYRGFVRECAKHSKIQPGTITNIAIDVLILYLVIGVALSAAAALLFRPKPPNKPIEIRQSSEGGQNVVNRSEYAPKAGFDSLQNVVELGSTIPLVYAKRETIGTTTYGGVRVNTNLLWSQMISQGGGQMLRAVFLIGEGTVDEIDPDQFALGDNVLGSYDFSTANSASSRVTFYVSKDGGRLVAADRVAGRSAANDPGNSENDGADDVYQIRGLNDDWTTDFCYAFKPSTQTQFGVYQLIGNGLGFRVNPQLRPAVVIKTEPAGETDTRIRCNTDGVAQAQRDKYNNKFSSRSGLTQKNGSGASGFQSLAVGDTVTYVLSNGSDANTTFIGVQEGPDHEETCRDVAQSVAGRQHGWDDAITIGDLYKCGTALMVCESRTPDNEIFSSEIDQDPVGGGQQISVLFRVVRAGTALLEGTGGTKSATETSHIMKVAISNFALPRPAQVLELGIRSSLGIQISGLCNFRDSLSQDEIDGRACTYFNNKTYRPDQSLEVSNYQSGSFSGTETRYSFFRIGYREAGSGDNYTYIDQCFGTRSVTRQASYNYLRLQMPSVARWEFRIEPLSGYEIRNNAVTGNLEVLDAHISGTRTITSGSGTSLVTAVFTGEPVARSSNTFGIPAIKNQNLGVTLQEGDSYADSWGKLAEAFVFNEISSSASNPEHEVVYVNLLTPNPNIPTYDNMALVGMNIRSSTEARELNQLSVYVNKGINSIHTFPEVLEDLLTNERYGAGSVLSELQVDTAAFAECATWTSDRRYFFDGALSAPVNLRQWASQTAGFFLLDLVIRNGKFSLQPAVYFDQRETITALYTAGNILEDSFELVYSDVDQRIPNRVSVKWREERASTDDNNKGLFPVIREVTVREAGTPNDAPLESIDLSDFCTSENHAIDVAKYICRGRRLTTHAVRFKTTPTAAALEVGRCFKLGLETVSYLQPNNGAIDSEGKITTTTPLEDGTYEVLLWTGTESTVREVDLEVTGQSTGQYRNAAFCLKQASVETRAYKVQSLGLDEDGNIQVDAIYFPLNANGYSAIVDGWDVDSNWNIQGRIGTSEDSGTTTSSFTGVSITGPGSVTVDTAATYSALVSGGTGTYTYAWSGSGVTFGSSSSATTTVTATSAGSKTITCTVTRGSTSIAANKTITAVTAPTVTTIGTVTISGDTTATAGQTKNYTVDYDGKPDATDAGDFVVGKSYQIVSVGTTDFTAIGADANTVGEVFVATGAGSGTGTADALSAAFTSWSWDSSTTGADASIENSGAPRATITFETAGTYVLTCTVSSPSASDSPQSDTHTVTVS